MKYQPLNLIDTFSPTPIAEKAKTSLGGCGKKQHLTIFERGKIPNFYIVLEEEPLAGFDIQYWDENGNFVHTQNVPFNSVCHAQTAVGHYYFFNDINATLPSDGYYQIAVGYTAPDTNDYFEVFDFARFVTDISCLYKVTFSNDCNIDGIPFVRCPDFQFCFFLNQESHYHREVPVYEPEYDTNKEGEDVAVYKKMIVEQTFRAMNITEALFKTIVYSGLYDYHQISYGTEDDETIDKIKKITFDRPVYVGGSCCIFYLPIVIIREYRTSDGCCDDVELLDCMEYGSQEVESIADDLQEPFLNGDGNCYLIQDDIPNTPTPWSTHFNEVACPDGSGGWIYTQPNTVFVANANSWYTWNGTNYVVENVILSASVTVVQNFPIGIRNVQVSGRAFDDYQVCIFMAKFGNGNTGEFEYVNEYTEAQFEAGVNFNFSFSALVGGTPPKPDYIRLKALFKKLGCKETMHEFIFNVNVP